MIGFPASAGQEQSYQSLDHLKPYLTLLFSRRFGAT
jgi:hypothetical protein